MLDFIEVFESDLHPGKWTWDCHDCKVGGTMSPDEENAQFDADQHIIKWHTDLQPWEMSW